MMKDVAPSSSVPSRLSSKNFIKVLQFRILQQSIDDRS